MGCFRPEIQRHQIEWSWVKGHSGHRENEICDELAKQGANNPTLDDVRFILPNKFHKRSDCVNFYRI